jgi:hypothetical protein
MVKNRHYKKNLQKAQNDFSLFFNASSYHHHRNLDPLEVRKRPRTLLLMGQAEQQKSVSFEDRH